MLTRAIELLIEGDDEQPPITDATFLWVTDQPELNEQTRRKMLTTSSVLKSENLLVIDNSFDQETLRPGTVHFLNIQKLGRDKSLVTPGDKRTYSIWDTIKNTIDARPAQFFVIIDEAHRGMTEDSVQAEAATITQKFIKGSPGEIPPMPIVVGISATPERFNQLILGTNRTNRSVDVDVEEVRLSGLIKELIILHHPKHDQPTDMTMLRQAARSLRKYTADWATYCAANEPLTVTPLLVVQVEDSNAKGRISETDIAQSIRTLRDELGGLPSEAFAHSFQEGTAVVIEGENLRYISPSEIQNDTEVRVVFFKTSLNTGWDCPRAEVMMSFRTAADFTYIAQLVGRMVRTPLARRIVDVELLNTVALYLPHYNSKALAKIVNKLSKPDDGMPPVDVQRSEDVVELHRAPGSEDAFRALADLPSYIVPRKRKANQVRRLMKLARLLTNDDIDDDAYATAKEKLIEVLNTEYESSKLTARFNEFVEGKRKIEIEAVNWDVGTDATRRGDVVRVDIASENVDDLFEATGRRLNEGLHKIWWRARVKDVPAEKEKAKLELFALCTNQDVVRKVERTAQELVQRWLHANRGSFASLDESGRAAYDEVRNLASTPELAPLIYPATLQAKQAEDSWSKHLYVSEEGDFTEEFNDIEAQVINEELRASEVVGWLRNTPRKAWALCVPYEEDGEAKPMYPDFLVIRSEGSRLVVDIVDPHTISLADAPAKAAGLAKFAAQHADKFGRIELIMVDGRTMKRLDLTEETVRNRVKGIQLPRQLKELFAET